MKTKQKNLRSALLILLPSVLLLGIGIIGMQTLASMKTPPARTAIVEKTLKVEVLKPELESVTPFIIGFGEVKAVDVVPVSAEIQGKVAQIHPQLEVGGLVNKREMLIRIDASEEQISKLSKDTIVEKFWTEFAPKSVGYLRFLLMQKSRLLPCLYILIRSWPFI